MRRYLRKRKLLGEKHGQQEADDHLRRHGEDHEHRRIGERVPIVGGREIVGQDLDVVVETNEADGLLVRLIGEEGKPSDQSNGKMFMTNRTAIAGATSRPP